MWHTGCSEDIRNASISAVQTDFVDGWRDCNIGEPSGSDQSGTIAIP